MNRWAICSAIALPFFAFFAPAAPSPDQDKEALAILDKAIEAHGGGKKLDKLMVEMTVRETPKMKNDTVPKTVEITWKPPDKLRVFSASDRKNELLFVFNGEISWKIDGRKKPIDLVPKDSDLRWGAAKYVTWGAELARYKNDRYKLSMLGESKEGERKLLGIKVRPEKVTMVPDRIVENAMKEDPLLAKLLEREQGKQKEVDEARVAAKSAEERNALKKLEAELTVVQSMSEGYRKKIRPTYENSLLETQGQEPEVMLFFDKETGLFIKRCYKCRPFTSGDWVQVEVQCEDYDENAGVRYPRKVTTFWDGNKVEERQVTKLNFPDTLDDSLFEPPK